MSTGGMAVATGNYVCHSTIYVNEPIKIIMHTNISGDILKIMFDFFFVEHDDITT